MKRLTRNLRNNSVEAFILAIETINRPTVTYRAEAFCFLFCNAWELLMKAKILNDGYKIFRKKKRKKPRESISLDECLDRIFTSENDPVKLNIRSISELRNNAIHLVIPFIPIGIMGLFQAGVLNFPKKLREWFNINLSDRIPLGMMVLIYDFDPKKHSLENAKMTRKLPAETVKWLSNFQVKIGEQSSTLGADSIQFCIPIDYRVAIVKNPNKADIVLSSGISGKEALIVEVPKDVDKTHPYRAKDAAELVNGRLAGKLLINVYDILCIRKVYNIEHRSEFYYKSRLWSPRYSELFVEWIVNQATRNHDFPKRARAKYKAQKQPIN
jgi:hypothetical protein